MTHPIDRPALMFSISTVEADEDMRRTNLGEALAVAHRQRGERDDIINALQAENDQLHELLARMTRQLEAAKT